MLTVSDIIKLLDQIPVWKTISGLPARLAALEARIAALEGARTTPDIGACALCGGAMKVTAEQPHPHFGVFGQKRLDVVCTACGATSTRDTER